MHTWYDGWIDIWRVVVLVACFASVVVLLDRFRHKRHEWNPKTLDYWYSLMSWSAAGLVIGIEGILSDRSATVALVFVTSASLVSLNGLRRRGDWGGSD